jgi:hypothetical protein
MDGKKDITMEKKSPNVTTALEPWIETFTGKEFHFLDPTHEQIDIRDIAHSLAYTCRYTGHSRKFYSVAEHSILVSYLAIDPLAGLLHDASEAYITDIASPIKPHLSNYKELEDMIMGRIASKFGFIYPLDPDIKDCDSTQLKTEAKHLLRSGGYPWAHLYPTRRPHGITPNCWSPEEAEAKFLERFKEVYNVTDFDSPTSPELGNESHAAYWISRGHVYYDGVQGVQLDFGLLREENCGGHSNHCGQDSRSESAGCSGSQQSFEHSTKANGTRSC